MKKKNPQDSTRRNVQAAIKRFAEMEKRLEYLESTLTALMCILKFSTEAFSSRIDISGSKKGKRK